MLAAIYWDVIKGFDLGPVTIRWYGILFALSFVIGYQIMQNYYKKENKSQKQLDTLAVIMIIATVVGARLGHCLLYDPEFYLSNPIEILKIRKGGLASHGAGAGILIGIVIYAKMMKDISFLWIIDRLSIVVALAGFFIRTGNFFNSEIYGHPADVPWAVIFASVDNIPRHPVQLYEALTYLIIFFLLFFLFKKTNIKQYSGRVFSLFLISVFGARFFLEYFKVSQAAFVEGWAMNMGQLLSIPFVLAGIILFIYSGRKKEK